MSNGSAFPPKLLYRLSTGGRQNDLSYPTGYGLDQVQDKCLSDQLRSYVVCLREDSSQMTTPASKMINEFEVDCQSPEVVTANQRACEVRIRGKG